MKKIKLVDVEVGDKKLDLTQIKEAKKYQMNIYDEALTSLENIYHEYRCPIGIIENALERAKKIEELLVLYKQQKKDREEHSLSSATLYWVLEKEIVIKEKELEAMV